MRATEQQSEYERQEGGQKKEYLIINDINRLSNKVCDPMQGLIMKMYQIITKEEAVLLFQLKRNSKVKNGRKRTRAEAVGLTRLLWMK